jgi:hypothetical protein
MKTLSGTPSKAKCLKKTLGVWVNKNKNKNVFLKKVAYEGSKQRIFSKYVIHAGIFES